MVSFGCHCEERKLPVINRRWRVVQRHQRCSAFDGYRVMSSDYSHVLCLNCGACGRTKANYVELLPDYHGK